MIASYRHADEARGVASTDTMRAGGDVDHFQRHRHTFDWRRHPGRKADRMQGDSTGSPARCMA
jgi:hypothetical protein